MTGRSARVGARAAMVAECIGYCAQRRHLRRTIRIALIVGVVLTLINQADVVLRGDGTAATVVKAGLNFVVPFIVSNLGLLAGRGPAGTSASG